MKSLKNVSAYEDNDFIIAIRINHLIVCSKLFNKFYTKGNKHTINSGI